jgi:hypothetical protein
MIATAIAQLLTKTKTISTLGWAMGANCGSAFLNASGQETVYISWPRSVAKARILNKAIKAA